jgi:SH3-like domain-containing protein
VPKANLRVGPGTNYDIGWQVFKYMPFEKVGKSLSGKWFAVKDVDNDVLWIHRNLVTEDFKCAVVEASEVNVRTGPGTNYSRSQMGPAKKYYSYRILDIRGNWVRLRDEWGNIGWIHRDHLWIP